MTEDQLEQETLGWLAEAGYTHLKARTSPRNAPTTAKSSCRSVCVKRSTA